ncbi:hypothetical protein ACSS6W_009090 [Trichoderma asperelloides]
MSTLEPLTRHILLSQDPNLFLMMMIFGCASTRLQRGDALLVPCCSFVGAADHFFALPRQDNTSDLGQSKRGFTTPPRPFRPVKVRAGS